jgi:hypothetical protein
MQLSIEIFRDFYLVVLEIQTPVFLIFSSYLRVATRLGWPLACELRYAISSTINFVLFIMYCSLLIC